MRDMPLLGRPRRRSGRRLALVVLLAGVAAAFVGWLIIAGRKTAAPAAPVASGPAATAEAAGVRPDAAPAPPPETDPLRLAGMRYMRANVDGPLETAIVAQVGREVGE